MQRINEIDRTDLVYLIYHGNVQKHIFIKYLVKATVASISKRSPPLATAHRLHITSVSPLTLPQQVLAPWPALESDSSGRIGCGSCFCCQKGPPPEMLSVVRGSNAGHDDARWHSSTLWEVTMAAGRGPTPRSECVAAQSGVREAWRQFRGRQESACMIG